MKPRILAATGICLLLLALSSCFGANDQAGKRSTKGLVEHPIALNAPDPLVRFGFNDRVEFLLTICIALVFGLFLIQTLVFFIFDYFRKTCQFSVLSFCFSLGLFEFLQKARQASPGYELRQRLGHFQKVVGLGDMYVRFLLFCLANLGGRVFGELPGAEGLVRYILSSLCFIVLAMRHWLLIFLVPVLLSLLSLSGLSGNESNVVRFGTSMKGPTTQNATIDSIIH